MMKNLCFILIQGGSKYILHKNLKAFMNKPIRVYSIEVVLIRRHFNDVMVSTEDEEYAEITNQYGTKICFIHSYSSNNQESRKTA